MSPDEAWSSFSQRPQNFRVNLYRRTPHPPPIDHTLVGLRVTWFSQLYRNLSTQTVSNIVFGSHFALADFGVVTLACSLIHTVAHVARAFYENHPDRLYGDGINLSGLAATLLLLPVATPMMVEYIKTKVGWSITLSYYRGGGGGGRGGRWVGRKVFLVPTARLFQDLFRCAGFETDIRANKVLAFWSRFGSHRFRKTF